MYEMFCIFSMFATALHVFPENIFFKSKSSKPYTPFQIESVCGMDGVNMPIKNTRSLAMHLG